MLVEAPQANYLLRDQEITVIRVPLASIAATPTPGRLRPCPRCGSQGFTVHQRSWKRLKDPHIHHVLVDRHRCKRCGWVGRSYPTGVGAGRQSDAQRQLSLLLYATGLSYAAVRAALGTLGADVSETTIRHNVNDARRQVRDDFRTGRLHLQVQEDGRLAGSDGALILRICSLSPSERWLEIAIVPGPGADELRWRVERGVHWVQQLTLIEGAPPESA